MEPVLAAAPALNATWPFAILGISVTLIVLLITVLRVHAFFALIIAAIVAGVLAPIGSLPGEPVQNHFVQAVELTTIELGNTAGKIALVIALASLISVCLMESGAADKVVRRFLALFGPNRAGAAIVASSYFLSIPIFFDTFFMLLLPLARALRVRTGRDYLLYVLAICCGGTVTHSLIAPHPGPLAMAETLKVDLGFSIIYGIAVGIVPTACSWLATKWLNGRMEIPLRETGGASLLDLQAIVGKKEDELPSFVSSILPVVLPIALISLSSALIAAQGRGFSLADLQNPTALAGQWKAARDPISQSVVKQFSDKGRLLFEAYEPGQPPARELQLNMLEALNRAIRSGRSLQATGFANVKLRPATLQRLSGQPAAENLVRLNRMLLEDSFAGSLRPTEGLPASVFSWFNFLGNRNVALVIGAAIAVFVLLREKGLDLHELEAVLGPPFETAGVIILITSAGGAFGLMLKNAGVGDAIKALVAGHEINIILLSWIVAAVIRIAQGSATVAMLTTAAMIYPIISGSALPYHPIYLFFAIGFGAMMLSWMNDSGFWVVGRLSGFTEKETLKTWTIIVSVNSIAGLITTMVLAWLLPMK